MKILILSCDTGEGHNSAAYAIAEACRKRGIDYTLGDPLDFGGEKTGAIVSSSYNGMIKKTPAAFSLLYKAGDIYSSTKLTSPVYLANSLYADSLKSYIVKNRFDAVICTHLFAMEALTAARKKTGFCIPCFGVLTDYTCVPFFTETKLDGYFIPHEDLRKEVADKGIPNDLIYGAGIPVSGRFASHMEKSMARDYLAIPQSKAVLMIMSGGVGCGNVIALCDELLKQSNEDYVAYVLVGRNRKLKEKMDRRYGDNDRIQSVAFTKKVNLYMNAADVMISKAGGLSSTEAAVANIPLVHLLVYTACESKNADFFASHELSVRAGSAKSAIAAALELIRNKEKAEKMRAMQRSCINPQAANDIVEKVISI